MMPLDLEERLDRAMKKPTARKKQSVSPIDVWSSRIVAMVDAVRPTLETLTPVALECEMSAIIADKVAIVGTADYVGFIDGKEFINDAGESAIWPSDKLVVLDWKTSEKSDGVYQYTRDVLPQLALYSMLARSHFNVDYFPAVAPVRLVYSTAASKASSATVQFGALREINQRIVDRAIAIARQDLAMKSASRSLGLSAPMPDSGNFKCSACAYQVECFNYEVKKCE